MKRSIPIPDDLPLPDGYTMDPKRRCSFSVDFDSQTGGFYGLALAVLIAAVQDGCNPKWLKQIVDFYGIKIEASIFDRPPARRLKMLPSEGQFVPIEYDGDKRKLALSWRDANPHLRQK